MAGDDDDSDDVLPPSPDAIVSDATLQTFISNSLYEVPFVTDRNSDRIVRDIANYYEEVRVLWPWIENSYVTANLDPPDVVVKLPTGEARAMVSSFFTIPILLTNKYVRLAGCPIAQLASLTQPKIAIVSESLPCTLHLLI